jgi:hypothetical protein
MTEKSAIKRIRTLNLRGAALLENAEEEALNKTREVISSTLFIEIGMGNTFDRPQARFRNGDLAFAG